MHQFALELKIMFVGCVLDGLKKDTTMTTELDGCLKLYMRIQASFLYVTMALLI